MSFTLLAQGTDWLAIDKPINMGMHTEADELGVVVQASQFFERPLWPVHRLDKVTSGILLLATSQEGAARLSELFAQQQIEKFYLAQSALRPKKKQGLIKGDMTKGRNGSWLLKRSMENPAMTRFVSHFDAASGTRLFLLKPITGRTHQLRVALKSLGSPIDGDQRYGGVQAERTFLHAYALRWQEFGQYQEIICPPSAGYLWVTLPDNWQIPWNND